MTRNGTAPNGKGDREREGGCKRKIEKRAVPLPLALLGGRVRQRQLDYRPSFVIICKWKQREESAGYTTERDWHPFSKALTIPSAYAPTPPPLSSAIFFKHAPPVTTQISRYRAPSSLASHELQEPGLHPNPLTPRSSPEFHPLLCRYQSQFSGCHGKF
ncbi:hypothetical protein CEXT_63261 [Caerostris extrusa]|uniref:Uncharacterized protein n=1 Tax=Caerostris extrusa TaxID=172846 RepID=A0AAV4RI90_CAEEX|nr:hypothetical protein CEXT_63261 [Caerostris extrusa]